MHPPLIPVGEEDFLQNNSDDPRPAQCPVGGGIHRLNQRMIEKKTGGEIELEVAVFQFLTPQEDQL